jgi:hypothetical protein
VAQFTEWIWVGDSLLQYLIVFLIGAVLIWLSRGGNRLGVALFGGLLLGLALYAPIHEALHAFFALILLPDSVTVSVEIFPFLPISEFGGLTHIDGIAASQIDPIVWGLIIFAPILLMLAGAILLFVSYLRIPHVRFDDGLKSFFVSHRWAMAVVLLFAIMISLQIGQTGSLQVAGP